MDRPHEDRHIAWCLTGFGDNLDCKEDDAQVVVRAMNEAPIPDSIEVRLDPQKAYALGLWLISAASRVENRYPNLKGLPK